MIPRSFGYVRPATAAEALDSLRQTDAKVLAGGQTLIPRLKYRTEQPDLIVDIQDLTSFDFIEVGEGVARIGCLVRQREIEDSSVLAESLPILQEAAAVVADPAVRSQGTLVGSLCAGDPSGDWPAVALALGGVLIAVGPGGERRIDLDEHFLGPHRTSLDPGELATRVELLIPGGGSHMAYRKIRHPASGYALVGVAAVVTVDQAGTCVGCRLALTGAGIVATRLAASEKTLLGRPLAPDTIARATSVATQDIELDEDIHAGREFRAGLVRTQVSRILSAMRTTGA
jgi:carbon-monoxide dehydrogenase medium subunit